MSTLKEELHTNGSRCILVLDDVSTIDRCILAKIQHGKGSQYASLTSEQPRTRKHKHSVQFGESYAIGKFSISGRNYRVSRSRWSTQAEEQ